MKMKEELTLADIRKTTQLIKENYKEEEIIEDHFQRIYAVCGIPTKIEIKPAGQKIIKEFFKFVPDNEKRKGKIATFDGIPIYVDDSNEM